MMNERYIITICITVGIALFACQPEGNMPVFNILLEDSSAINTASIPAGKPVLMIFYSGECPECHEEARAIMHRIDDLKDVRVYMITLEPLSEVSHFKTYLGLNKYKDIVIGSDTARAIPHFLRNYNTPQLMLFDSNKNMRVVFRGRADVDTLLRIIHSL